MICNFFLYLGVSKELLLVRLYLVLKGFNCIENFFYICILMIMNCLYLDERG